jgi:serine protease AprX
MVLSASRQEPSTCLPGASEEEILRKKPIVAPSWLVQVAAGVVAVSFTAVGQPASSGSDRAVDVIVRTAGPVESRAAQDYVRGAGGTVRSPLSLISGFAASLPGSVLPDLRASAGVAEVTPDGSVQMSGDSWRDDSGWNSVDDIKDSAADDENDDDSRSGNSWGDSGYSSEADGWWGDKSEEPTGSGIGVALIDSGVAPVPGLDKAGKVVHGPDLSFESQAPNLRQMDTYGHGTHMAGIIAGSDAATPSGVTRFDGIAPGARLVSLKVAAADGATDVSQVIAAIDWVVQHRNDTGLNIRVLNLSFGTDSVQDARLDPLSYAVEAAWRKGIVVVVAVGNDGAAADRVTMPAANPFVITVGAADPNGTVSRVDDTVATFSTRGNATRHADLLAAGRSVVSLRAPGSYVDVNYPGARITDATGKERLMRGSGTSQAAAVVSGSVALLLEQRPSLTPNQVKKLLMDTADPLTGADPISAGAGQLDIASAMTAATPYYSTQKDIAATGLGTLEGSRGTAHVADSDTGEVLIGERDIFGAPWVGATWVPLARDAKAWKGGSWNGNVWTGSTFDSAAAGAKTWVSVPWTARTWSGQLWTARTWSSAEWDGTGWTARTWSARTWSARTWSSLLWPDSPWQ